MTVVEGQIASLKKLTEVLREKGITRFNSVGDINRFVNNYETEKQQLRSRLEAELDAGIQAMRSSLTRYQQDCEELTASIRNEITHTLQELDAEIKRAKDKSARSLFYSILYCLKIRRLSRRRSKLERNSESIIKKKTRAMEDKVRRLQSEIADCLMHRTDIILERYRKCSQDLVHTKEVVDGLHTLIAGAIGENAVVNVLKQLSDDYYLFNDFSLDFNPPIYNKKEGDRIFSIQIDHLLVCQSGVFILETKNWSKRSIESLDLRSPVTQIFRTNFALYVLLNSDSALNSIQLDRHHWGSKKIPIRNVIVMINERPKADFKHVKVLTLSELNGYIQYFEPLLSGPEVTRIFEYLSILRLRCGNARKRWMPF